MEKVLPTTIRFIREWRGRPIGFVADGFDYGTAHELVRRGVAEWFTVKAADPAPPAVPEVRPVAVPHRRGRQ